MTRYNKTEQFSISDTWYEPQTELMEGTLTWMDATQAT